MLEALEITDPIEINICIFFDIVMPLIWGNIVPNDDNIKFISVACTLSYGCLCVSHAKALIWIQNGAELVTILYLTFSALVKPPDIVKNLVCGSI